ncbi:MAG: hypothetical protein RML12_09505 [Xanthomonadales bacterium]|nr:hypothetical protein [Xanthomonadales bacterium]
MVALAKPSERERGQWYFQRYVAHLPAAGEIVLFDRSWYNRAGVERVMGYCSTAEYRLFLRQVARFERLLAEDGIRILKYWLAVSQEEQERRFAERACGSAQAPQALPDRPRRAASATGSTRGCASACSDASHRPWAPWFLVDFEDQRRGRLNLIRHLLDQLPFRASPGSPGRPAAAPRSAGAGGAERPRRLDRGAVLRSPAPD